MRGYHYFGLFQTEPTGTRHRWPQVQNLTGLRLRHTEQKPRRGGVILPLLWCPERCRSGARSGSRHSTPLRKAATLASFVALPSFLLATMTRSRPPTRGDALAARVILFGGGCAPLGMRAGHAPAESFCWRIRFAKDTSFLEGGQGSRGSPQVRVQLLSMEEPSPPTEDNGFREGVAARWGAWVGP